MKESRDDVLSRGKKIPQRRPHMTEDSASVRPDIEQAGRQSRNSCSQRWPWSHSQSQWLPGPLKASISNHTQTQAPERKARENSTQEERTALP